MKKPDTLYIDRGGIPDLSRLEKEIFEGTDPHDYTKKNSLFSYGSRVWRKNTDIWPDSPGIPPFKYEIEVRVPVDYLNPYLNDVGVFYLNYIYSAVPLGSIVPTGYYFEMSRNNGNEYSYRVKDNKYSLPYAKDFLLFFGTDTKRVPPELRNIVKKLFGTLKGIKISVLSAKRKGNHYSSDRGGIRYLKQVDQKYPLGKKSASKQNWWWTTTPIKEVPVIILPSPRTFKAKRSDVSSRVGYQLERKGFWKIIDKTLKGIWDSQDDQKNYWFQVQKGKKVLGSSKVKLPPYFKGSSLERMVKEDAPKRIALKKSKRNFLYTFSPEGLKVSGSAKHKNTKKMTKDDKNKFVAKLRKQVKTLRFSSYPFAFITKPQARLLQQAGLSFYLAKGKLGEKYDLLEKMMLEGGPTKTEIKKHFDLYMGEKK